jgi:hypothetical protein
MIFYRCHACGFVHEAEDVRRNLHVGGHSIADLRESRRGAVPVLGRHLMRRRTGRALMRTLWGRQSTVLVIEADR